MFFSDCTGQHLAAQRIRRAIDDDRMPHALMLCGREGSGALRLALATAQYILCTHRTPEGEPCGECLACRQAQKMAHPDLHFVFPVVNRSGQSGDNSAISDEYLDDWREQMEADPDVTYSNWVKRISQEGKTAQIYVNEATQIIRKLSMKPYESDYRVMIIWLPERINEKASNKLLKIIEEPYEKTHFLLVSNEPDHVLGTIQSRCQRINLAPIDPNWLQPQPDADDRELFLDLFRKMMRFSYARKLFDMRQWSLDISELGRERQQSFLQYAQAQIRENYLLNYVDAYPTVDGQPMAEASYLQADEAEFATRFHLFVNHRNVEGIMKELEQAERDIAQNGLAKIVFFDLSLKLIMLLKNGNPQ